MTKLRFDPSRLCGRRAGTAAAAQPVSIQVDTAKHTGPLRPVWSFFGHDEPNYTYMKDGRKLLSELAALSPVPVYMRVHSLLVTGDGEAALKWGSTNAYTEDAVGQAGLRLDHRRPHLRYLHGAQDEAAGPDRLHARSALLASRSRTGITGSPATTTTTSTPAGPIRRRTTTNGRNWSINGSLTASRSTAGRRWSPGCGRSGTSRISAIGRARPRSITSSTTTPWTP